MTKKIFNYNVVKYFLIIKIMNECLNWEPWLTTGEYYCSKKIEQKTPYYIDEKNIPNNLKKQELWDFQKIIFWWDKIIWENSEIISYSEELFLFLKEWKHYIYNKEWNNIFLKWVIKQKLKSNINLCKIDWKNLISVEFDWKEAEYFLENWEKYIPKTIKEKIIPWFKKAVDNILKFIQDIWNSMK